MMENTYENQDMDSIFGSSRVSEYMHTPYGFVIAADQDIQASTIQKFKDHYGLSLEQVSSLISVSEPTIYRWIQDDRSLDKNISIKLLELTNLFQYAIRLFESKKAFFAWLLQANISIGGIAPMQLLEIPEGINKVRDIIGRIEYGVYS